MEQGKLVKNEGNILCAQYSGHIVLIKKKKISGHIAL
jgi:hypothetical protein